MDSNTVTNIAVAALVVVWLLTRQLQVRPLKAGSRIGVVLLLAGAVQAYSAFGQQQLTASDLARVLVSIMIGAAIAAVRGYTVRIWRTDGATYRQGTMLTAVLWLVSIGLHLVVDRLVSPGLGSATLLLYLGAVLAVQQVVLVARGRAMGVLAPVR